jgi:hypothetical protein
MWNTPQHVATSEGKAEFDQVSLPRHQPFSFGQLFTWLVSAVGIFWAVILLLTAMQWYRMNSTDHLIVGNWRSLDDPSIDKIQFSADHYVQGFTSKGEGFQLSYRFLAQSTIEITEPWSRPPRAGAFLPRQAKVQFDGRTMTLVDVHTGAVTSWQR